MNVETFDPAASTAAWEPSACATAPIDCVFSSFSSRPADARVTQRVSPPGAGGRVYLLELRIDPITRAVLSYRLRLAPTCASS